MLRRIVLAFVGSALVTWFVLRAPVAEAIGTMRGPGALCISGTGSESYLVSAGELMNMAVANAVFYCPMPTGDGGQNGWIASNDVDEMLVDVYDALAAPVVTVDGYSHGSTRGSWSSCGTDSTGQDQTGNRTLGFTGLQVAGSCMDFLNRQAILRVQLPGSPQNGLKSSIIAWRIKDTD